MFKLFSHKKKYNRVLFYRDFRAYSGGHQKVADYFNHLLQSKQYRPDIAFSHETLWDKSNPWYPEYQQQQSSFRPNGYDALFLAGMDWQQYLQQFVDASIPVVNLIQGVRHAESDQKLHTFLTQKAIRICVSPEVESAILATGLVNGPTFCISNGHSMPALPSTTKQWDFLVVGAKQPALALTLAEQLKIRSDSVKVFNQLMPRDKLLEAMTQARVAVLLPRFKEGFYLPALEAMHYCDLTVVPDCVGNRSFCIHNSNCLLTDFSVESILAACDRAAEIIQCPRQHASFKKMAKETVGRHTLQNERKQFLDIMRRLPQLWKG